MNWSQTEKLFGSHYVEGLNGEGRSNDERGMMRELNGK